MKRLMQFALFVLLLMILNTGATSAREPYWAEYQIDVSGVSEEKVLLLESTLTDLSEIKPGDIKINRRVYRRLSRFQELFGFSFNGKDLVHWLLSRIDGISYRNTWTTALNQNQGSFFIGDSFFTELSLPERLYLLIHEARHSDKGRYKHIDCPKDFKFISAAQPEIDLENQPSCDADDRGAYSFQAAFLFELFAYGIFDQNEIGLLYNSSISRMPP